jgi:hypothetical protein
MVRLHRCELALRAGDLDNASLLLDEWSESSDFDTQFRPQYQRSRALLAAGRGDVGDTKRWATEAIERARTVNCRWDELEALRARAMAAQLEQTPEQAVEDLGGVWEHCDREGVLDPGAFPVGPDLVEALVELGEMAPARKATKRLGELARKQDHPWGKAAEKRCRGLVLLAPDQHDEAGAALLEDAAGDFERLGLRFDAARCQLALGRALRRAKRWRGAREALEAAITGFAVLGSNGWADRARAELCQRARSPLARDRIGGEGDAPTRRPRESKIQGFRYFVRGAPRVRCGTCASSWPSYTSQEPTPSRPSAAPPPRASPQSS